MHKGEAGRVGILAGSVGFTGAARLAAEAAARAGAGMVTLFCPQAVWSELSAACPPEVMVRPLRSAREILEARLDVVAVGPGLGLAPPPDLLTVIRCDERPMVVDADGLNALAALPRGMDVWPAAGPRLLTPHPGEMARLLARFAPRLAESSMAEQAGGLALVTGATVLLKGSRSCVAAPEGTLAWNASGHPAMARGGMGDVLTGMAAAFLAGGLAPFGAACLASWLIGAGAESWLRRNGWAVEALSASAVLRHACRRALPELRAGGIF
jgi:NAD(P)H-hydrate epimerase